MTLLHHVQVRCPAGGETEARSFYGDLLGLEEVDKPPELAKRGGVWFRGAGYELHVGVETPFTPAKKAHPAFLVDDVDSCAARFEAAGFPVGWDGNFPEYRRFHTCDPHGNRVEILGRLDAIAGSP
jgi:catechol 2,3-dioxygenase-like lactoylglutathione lyase family enzyme